MPDIDVPPESHEASNPSLHARVIPPRKASVGIEAFALTHRVLLHGIRNMKDGREGVAELDDTEGCDDGYETEVVWYRTCNDERD